jgi:glutamate carboxypeptidase
VMLAALRAVEASPLAARIGYDVVINSDEETGSFSSAALLARAAHGKVAALTYEPALADGTLAGARGGTGNFSIIVHGRSAHAGRNPEDGRNALVAAADIAVRLSKVRGPRLAVNPARIEGGGPIDDGAARLFDLVKASGADLGLDIAWKATGGVCDGNNIAAAGVPVVDTMGVRGGAIHSTDEFMIPDSLAERAALSAVTILRIAEGRL